MESIIETLCNKGQECASEQKTNHFKSEYGRKIKKIHKQMKQPTKASTEKRENFAFTWNSWIGVCKPGLPEDTSVLVISTLPGNTLLH